MSVLPNSRSIRYSYRFYQSSPDVIKAAALVLYGLKCYLSLRRHHAGNPQLVYFASYPNEHRVLGHIRNILGPAQHDEISVSLRNCFSFASLRGVLAVLPAIPRLYRFALRLAQRFDFMPACRIFSTVTYYKRFSHLLNEDIRAVFIACHYSPECLGLAAAAHRAAKKVLFTNHANATGETSYVAPLHADLVAVTSEAMADVYRRHTPHDLNIVPFTIAEPQSAMKLPDRNSTALTVGIYLTALTNKARLQKIVAEWSNLPAVRSIVIRMHPAQIVNAELGDVDGGRVGLDISHTNPLSDDIQRTDVAVCGNSTVVIEILRGGRPVLYDHRLDDLVFDYNGYAGHGLVAAYPQILDDSVFDRLHRHYLDERWCVKMQYFDSGYRGDEAAIGERFVAAVTRELKQA